MLNVQSLVIPRAPMNLEIWHPNLRETVKTLVTYMGLELAFFTSTPGANELRYVSFGSLCCLFSHAFVVAYLVPCFHMKSGVAWCCLWFHFWCRLYPNRKMLTSLCISILLLYNCKYIWLDSAYIINSIMGCIRCK